MRLFLAVPLSDAARASIRERLHAAFPDGAPGRPVPAANWHLTLRFLGETADDRAARLAAEMKAAPLGPPFEIAFGALGAFPRPSRAAVLWVGVTDGAQALAALAGEVEGAARRAGFPAEERPFAAHLTVSRFRPPESVAERLGGGIGPPIAMPVSEVVLYRSHLGGGPPRYEAVERFPLS